VRTIAELLAATPVSSVDLSRYVKVNPADSVQSVVGLMRAAERSAACVVIDHKIVGIFTQRNVVSRILGQPRLWGKPVSEEMSQVRSIGHQATIADGSDLMHTWWVRNAPVVDSHGDFVGNLNYAVVMQTIINLLAAKIGPDGGRSGLGVGLQFVDFTGVNLTPAAALRPDDTVERAVSNMRNRGLVSVLVVDDRERLVGKITEFDLVMKVGCERDDLWDIPLSEIMDPSPLVLSMRSPLTAAIESLAIGSDSSIPLVGETERPAGVAAFRDIVSFIETNGEAFDV